MVTTKYLGDEEITFLSHFLESLEHDPTQGGYNNLGTRESRLVAGLAGQCLRQLAEIAGLYVKVEAHEAKIRRRMGA